MAIQRIAIVFDRVRPDTTGVHCRKTLSGLARAIYFHLDRAEEIPARIGCGGLRAATSSSPPNTTPRCSERPESNRSFVARSNLRTPERTCEAVRRGLRRQPPPRPPGRAAEAAGGAIPRPLHRPGVLRRDGPRLFDEQTGVQHHAGLQGCGVRAEALGRHTYRHLMEWRRS